MATKPNITVSPMPDTTPEQARDARARAWSYIFQCFEQKEEVSHVDQNGSNFSNQEPPIMKVRAQQ